MAKLIKKYESKFNWDNDIFEDEDKFYEVLCEEDKTEEEVEDLLNTYIFKNNGLPYNVLNGVISEELPYGPSDVRDELEYDDEHGALTGYIYFSIGNTIYGVDIYTGPVDEVTLQEVYQEEEIVKERPVEDKIELVKKELTRKFNEFIDVMKEDFFDPTLLSAIRDSIDNVKERHLSKFKDQDMFINRTYKRTNMSTGRTTIEQVSLK